MMTDPIADMLSRIRNAIMAQHDRTEIPLSKLKLGIAQILKNEGFISDFSVDEEHPPKLTVHLKYGRDKSSAIMAIKRRSRPGKRIYVGHKDLPKVLNGMGLAIISTSQGLLTSNEARKKGIGGEFICEVW